MKSLSHFPIAYRSIRPVSMSMLFLVLAGCSFAPHLVKPDAPIPLVWAVGPVAEKTSSFGLDELVLEPVLRQLVDAALNNNRDLRQAMLNVEAARLRYRVQQSDRLSELVGRASLVRGKSSVDDPAGILSGDLSNLFEEGRSFWSFIPSIQVPIFSGGLNRANLGLAEVRKEIAIAKYEGTVQIAFREVADALSNYEMLERELRHRQALLDRSRVSLDLSAHRLQSGLDSNLRYLDSQRAAFNNEIALIDISTELEVSLVQAFKRSSVQGAWWALVSTCHLGIRRNKS